MYPWRDSNPQSVSLEGTYVHSITPQGHILLRTDIALRLLFNPLSTIANVGYTIHFSEQYQIKLTTSYLRVVVKSTPYFFYI